MIRQNGSVQLSKRLQALADLAAGAETVADVGCDHGFLEIYLIQSGRARRAIAMDVRKGPLAAARKHICEAGLEALIETRFSDGLQAYAPGEAQVLVCAGMGGPLMQRILSEDPEKTESFREMIVQPQSELTEFRRFLRRQGYRTLEEKIVLEDGKYYFPMKVCPGAPKEEEGGGKRPETDEEEWEIYDRFGELLILRREPLLLEYLSQQQRILEEIRKGLGAANAQEERSRERLAQVEREAEFVREAVRRMTG